MLSRVQALIWPQTLIYLQKSMKIIVAHISPDWDAITSVWLIKKYLSGWQEATVKFVPAGQRLKELSDIPKG
jgi:nanoRNase/pAp phosphatase (c-di-AMP/oligoRNAs hydrolase)